MRGSLGRRSPTVGQRDPRSVLRRTFACCKPTRPSKGRRTAVTDESKTGVAGGDIWQGPNGLRDFLATSAGFVDEQHDVDEVLAQEEDLPSAAHGRGRDRACCRPTCRSRRWAMRSARWWRPTAVGRASTSRLGFDAIVHDALFWYPIRPRRFERLRRSQVNSLRKPASARQGVCPPEKPRLDRRDGFLNPDEETDPSLRPQRTNHAAVGGPKGERMGGVRSLAPRGDPHAPQTRRSPRPGSPRRETWTFPFPLKMPWSASR